MGNDFRLLGGILIVPSASAGRHLFGEKKKFIPNFPDQNPNLKSKSSNINLLDEP
jgi:hypothetical protein